MRPEQAEAFNRLRPRLVRACRSYLGSQGAEAEDIVEDARRIAGPRLDPREDPQTTSGWLLQLCRQLCGERLRCRSGIVRGLEADLGRARIGLEAEKVDSTNLSVLKQHWLRLLCEDLKPLSLQSRQVIQLRNVKGLTYAQIAATLGLNWESVALRLAEGYLELQAGFGRGAAIQRESNLRRGPWAPAAPERA